MEPLTTIETRTCTWLGIVALVFGAVAELVSLANGNSRTLSCTSRASARNSSRARGR